MEQLCDICERSFAIQRGLKQHQGRQHKDPALSSIPQMDGAADAMIDDDLFCKTCENCNETKTIDDLSYHLMNDHEVVDVTNSYGKKWIDERLHCIRSPFQHLNPH